MIKNTRCAIVIPARLSSTRLSEKLLRTAGGKSILQHTYESAVASSIADQVVVAVDHQRLADEVTSFGGTFVMTSRDCASGTDRIAEVARQMQEVDLFVNVQGDEPEIEPQSIDVVAQALLASPEAMMSTVGTPIRDRDVLEDPSNVKIVLGEDKTIANRAGQGRAVYFSRSVVPHVRDGITQSVLQAEPPYFWHHLGLYAYRREFLEWFANQPPSFLEKAERLEQLRALEAGKVIVVARVDSATPGIDTQADLDAFVARLESRK